MNSQSWAKTVTQNRKKCEKILAVSKDIRYSGIFNEYGRTISGKIKPGVKPIFSPDSVRHEFFAIASMMRLRERTSKVLGEIEFISITHKKINILLFYKNGMTYYITINKKTKSNTPLINKIKKLITQV
jgi:ribosomal protein L30/L7E